MCQRQNDQINPKHEKLKDFMKNNNKWHESLLNELPRKYEKYGDLVLFSHPSFQSNLWSGNDLWSLVCKLYQGNRIAIKRAIKNDEFRTPQVELVYGESSEVVFNDNGVIYAWDVLKTMFSAGNISERHRIGGLNCDGEVIVDLYAGIGYFSIPYLVKAKAAFLHACEWNPAAVIALKRNLEINNVLNRCEIHVGDNREVCPKNVANRVNLGLIPSSELSWHTACEALVPCGGIMYVHQNVNSKKPLYDQPDFNINESLGISANDEHLFYNNYKVKWKKEQWLAFAVYMCKTFVQILKSVKANNWEVSIEEVIKVKSYAPHIDHLVYSINCKPITL